jgi:hypothetical protein
LLYILKYSSCLYFSFFIFIYIFIIICVINLQHVIKQTYMLIILDNFMYEDWS